MQYRRSVQGRMLLIELETSARTESKRTTNHNTPQLSRMGLPVHCATFHGVSRLNTRAVPAWPTILQSGGTCVVCRMAGRCLWDETEEEERQALLLVWYTCQRSRQKYLQYYSVRRTV
jgi:hypothetical protein